MKKQNGFIATSLLYTFFLAFVTLFIGVVTLHLQNRVYLNKLEDSSKNAIYLREMKEGSKRVRIENAGVIIDNADTLYIEGNIFQYEYDDLSGGHHIETCNFAKCEKIFYYDNVNIVTDDEKYILEGCDCS